jgi:phage-related protein
MIAPPILRVRFYLTDTGAEPVRVWLRALPGHDRKTIGAAIMTVQFGWPLGMPLVRKLDDALWEVRVHLEGRIARVLFTLFDHDRVLLHGFIKKSRAIPKDDLKRAKDRLKSLRSVQ